MPDKLVKDSTLRSYVAEYRSKADEIVKRNPRWVTGDPQERRTEYLEIADYFDSLVES